MRALAIAGCVLLARAASADGPDFAALHAERGSRLYVEGDFERAVREFEAALAVKSDPDLLLAIGRAYQRLGEPARAVDAYTRYLSAVPNAVNIEEVNRLIRELTPQTVPGAPPPERDELPPRIRHEPVAEWTAGEPIRVEASMADPSGLFEPKLYYRLDPEGAFVPNALQPEGDRQLGLLLPVARGEVQYFLEAYDTRGNGPARNGTPTYPHAIKITGAPPAAEGRGPWAYVTLGAGALAAGVGAFLGAQAIAAGGDWAAGRSVSAREEALSDARGMASGANFAWGAAGVLLAGGGALLLFTDL